MSEFNGVAFIATKQNEIDYTAEQIQTVALRKLNQRSDAHESMGFFQFLIKAGSNTVGINISERLKNTLGLNQTYYPMSLGEEDKDLDFLSRLQTHFSSVMNQFGSAQLTAQLQEQYNTFTALMSQWTAEKTEQTTALNQIHTEKITELSEAYDAEIAKLTASFVNEKQALVDTLSLAEQQMQEVETKLNAAEEKLSALGSTNSSDVISEQEVQELISTAIQEYSETVSVADTTMEDIPTGAVTQEQFEAFKEELLIELRAEVPD